MVLCSDVTCPLAVGAGGERTDQATGVEGRSDQQLAFGLQGRDPGEAHSVGCFRGSLASNPLPCCLSGYPVLWQ